MNKMTKLESSFELWRLIGKVNHSILLIRQKELRQHHIPVRQLHVLGAINDLGSKATLWELAKLVEREPNVMSKTTIVMEKDGLIKRIKTTPKSNLLRLELTETGRGLIKHSRQSKSIEGIFSSLSDEDRRQLNSILKKVLIGTQKYNSI